MPRGTEQEASISDERLSTVSGKISEVAKVLQSLDCISFPGGLSTQVISNSRALAPKSSGHQCYFSTPLLQDLLAAQHSFPAATFFFKHSLSLTGTVPSTPGWQHVHSSPLPVARQLHLKKLQHTFPSHP